ncbi:class I SAM-dependent methyltransferase [Candidatus Bathyarchaeota archaeon]|nr:MAG: class I SAM-dependent methyltransferase [Candidatus Bathyarchaeota archaeon]
MLQDKQAMRDFWDRRPCGSSTSSKPHGTKEFFDEIEAYRYQVEPCIKDFARFEDSKAKRVLEVGVGMGTDSIQFVRHGARFTGIDLSWQSLRFTQQRFRASNYVCPLFQADAEVLPFPANVFDVVYSWGVLLCVKNIRAAVAEVWRVLRPGGKAVVMLYHKNSLNYWISIMVIRRLAYWLLRSRVGLAIVDSLSRLDRTLRTKLERTGSLRGFTEELQRKGSLTDQELLNMSTDGPGLPYTSVYTRQEVQLLFSKFRIVKTNVCCLYEQNVPFCTFLPQIVKTWLAGRCGWFLVVEATK